MFVASVLCCLALSLVLVVALQHRSGTVQYLPLVDLVYLAARVQWKKIGFKYSVTSQERD